MSKKYKTLSLSLDPYENALQVTYCTLLPDNTETSPKDTKVRLKTIKRDADLDKLGKDVVSKCKYINSGRINEVNRLVQELYDRQTKDDDSEEDVYGGGMGGGGNNFKGEALMDNIDDYMEQLYGSGQSSGDPDADLFDKIKGSKSILQLCTQVVNLETLIQNMQLMSALTRVLNDDYKRSMELSFNLCRIFLSFSNFMEMHGILMNYKVGVMAMKVVELELKRSEHRIDEMNGVENAKERVLSRRQDKVIFCALHVLINLAEDNKVEKKMVKKSLVELLTKTLKRPSPDSLMLVLAFLKKLSTFIENVEAMCIVEELEEGELPYDTIYLISKLVPCSHDNLIHSSLRVLFNLSFHKPARLRMIAVGLLPKLVDLLKRAPFRARVLKLLYHLSADDGTKRMLSKTEAIPVVMQLVINFPNKIIPMELASLAVNISLDPTVAEMMAEGRGIGSLLTRVEDYGDVLVCKVLRNLSMWTYGVQVGIAKIAEFGDKIKEERRRIGEVKRFEALALKKANSKMTKGTPTAQEEKSGFNDDDNASKSSVEDNSDIPVVPQYLQRRLWSEHVHPLLKLAQTCESHDLLVEILGILGNLNEQDFPKGCKWYHLMKEFNLTGFIGKLLVPGMSQNDVILECVILVGQMCVDEKSSVMIASSTLIRGMHELWQDKSDDSEIALQLLTAFLRMLSFNDTREELLYSTEALTSISSSLTSPHAPTRVVAEKCLALVLEHDRSEDGELGELGTQVRRRRFLAHNKEWIETVVGEGGRQDRVYRHNGSHALDSSEDGSEEDDSDRQNWGQGSRDDHDHFVAGNGQRVAIDTSGLSSEPGIDDDDDDDDDGRDDDSREFDGGWEHQ